MSDAPKRLRAPQTPPLDFTVVTVAGRGLHVAKIVSTSKVEVPKVKHWRFQSVTVDGLHGLGYKLLELADQRKSAIIRGAPVPGLDLTKPHRRLLYADAESPATLVPCARRWIALDIDGARVPSGMGDAHYMRTAADYIRQKLLPPEWRDVDMMVSATSSTGRKGDDRAHLRMWAVLSEPATDEALNAYAAAVAFAKPDLKLDPALFNPVQIHFTCRMFDGVPDPVERRGRVVYLPGSKPTVTPDFAGMAAFARPFIEAEASAAAAHERRGDWRGALDATVGGIGGFYRPLTEGIGLAVRLRVPVADVQAFVAELLETKDGGAERRDTYSAKWVAYSYRRFLARDAYQDKRFLKRQADAVEELNSRTMTVEQLKSFFETVLPNE